MQDGDSIYFDEYDKISSVRSNAVAYFGREGKKMKVVTRREGDGFRLWTIKIR